MNYRWLVKQLASTLSQQVEALIENFPPNIKQQLLSQLDAMNPAQKKQFYDTQLVLLLRLYQQQQARKKLLQQKQVCIKKRIEVLGSRG